MAELKGKQRQPPVIQPGSGNSIIINPCQRLNPVVECIRNVPKEFGDILPDYQVGRTTGVVFLSLRYHRLHPEYIHQRIERLGQSYNLRILLLMCDISEHQEPIRELTRVCLLNNITVIVAWSADEAGQYLTAYKQSEHRPPTLIRERVDKTPDALLRTALTSIPRVNKTDVETLRTSFGSFARIAHADAAQLRASLVSARKRSRGSWTRLSGRSARARRVPRACPRLRPSPPRRCPSPPPPPRPRPPPATAQQQQQSTKDIASEPRPAQGSSVWDIELDLNSPSPSPPPPPEPAHGAQATAGPSKRAREESPPWDIERDHVPDPDPDSDSDADAYKDGDGMKVRTRMWTWTWTSRLRCAPSGAGLNERPVVSAQLDGRVAQVQYTRLQEGVRSIPCPSATLGNTLYL
ncbi:restriction endonuclease type II-like protein [Russula brevipes]|nr:restriction endonuclease type II-like protein [Russula brevipes]